MGTAGKAQTWLNTQGKLPAALDNLQLLGCRACPQQPYGVFVIYQQKFERLSGWRQQSTPTLTVAVLKANGVNQKGPNSRLNTTNSGPHSTSKLMP